jgi:hypothetical protein
MTPLTDVVAATALVATRLAAVVSDAGATLTNSFWQEENRKSHSKNKPDPLRRSDFLVRMEVKN